MSEIMDHLTATHRELNDRTMPVGEGKAAVMRRQFDATIEDVWDALTDADRLKRWFLPVSGDLRLGGHYQIEGNASGKVLVCERPHLLKVTWNYGFDPDIEGVSEVEVRLSEGQGGTTTFELVHAAVTPPEMWDQFGPGAVGVGWDQMLLGLGLHMAGNDFEGDIETWHETDEGREFIGASSQAWRVAHEANGASAAEAAAAAEQTFAFYAPEPGAGDKPTE